MVFVGMKNDTKVVFRATMAILMRNGRRNCEHHFFRSAREVMLHFIVNEFDF
jgi:hypothetical protein